MYDNAQDVLIFKKEWSKVDFFLYQDTDGVCGHIVIFLKRNPTLIIVQVREALQLWLKAKL